MLNFWKQIVYCCLVKFASYRKEKLKQKQRTKYKMHTTIYNGMFRDMARANWNSFVSLLIKCFLFVVHTQHIEFAQFVVLESVQCTPHIDLSWVIFQVCGWQWQQQNENKKRKTKREREREIQNGMQISNFKMEMHPMILDWMESNRIELDRTSWEKIEIWLKRTKSVNINALSTSSRSQSISVKAIISTFYTMCAMWSVFHSSVIDVNVRTLFCLLINLKFTMKKKTFEREKIGQHFSKSKCSTKPCSHSFR